MSRVSMTPRIPSADTSLLRELKAHAMQINLLSEGRAASINNATSTPPPAGQHALGDFVRNSTPTELGAAGSKYVVFGWLCVAGGSPGTWVECRFLTGN